MYFLENLCAALQIEVKQYLIGNMMLIKHE